MFSGHESISLFFSKETNAIGISFDRPNLQLGVVLAKATTIGTPNTSLEAVPHL